MAAEFDNKAAWQPVASAKQLQVGPGPDQSNPAVDEVVIKVAAVAINPSEWKVSKHNTYHVSSNEGQSSFIVCRCKTSNMFPWNIRMC